MSDFINRLMQFSQEELYYKKIHDTMPEIYNDPAYRKFDHFFVTGKLISTEILSNSIELTHRMFTFSLNENSLKALSGTDKCELAFTKHERYSPSRYHAHRYLEIVYQYSGTSLHNVNGEEVILKSGDMYFLPPDTFHSIISPGENNLSINIGISLHSLEKNHSSVLQSDKLFASFLRGCINSSKDYNYLLIKTGNDHVIQNLFANAMEIQRSFPDGENTILFLHSAISQLFTLILIKYSCVPNVRSTKNFGTIVNIISAIRSNYKDITLADLADTFHFTVPYISRLIHFETGHTFSELLCNLKINNALLLLENTRLPVSEIAAYVGYKAPENFMRTFKNIYGVTPSEYRKNESKTQLSFK